MPRLPDKRADLSTHESNYESSGALHLSTGKKLGFDFRTTRGGALEIAALKLAVERGGTAFRADLAAIVEAMRAAKGAGDRKAYLRHDTPFHSCFCQHSGSRPMAQTYALDAGKIAALRTHLSRKQHHTELSFSEHLGMLEVIQRGELAKALTILEVHIARARTTYAATIRDNAAADRRSESLDRALPAQ
jgi:DNA-binding GntR family transcriptional regulator